jgi:hypothetical protein
VEIKKSMSCRTAAHVISRFDAALAPLKSASGRV